MFYTSQEMMRQRVQAYLKYYFIFLGPARLFLKMYLLAKCHLIQQLRLQVLLNDKLTAVSVAARKEGFPPCKTAEPYSLCALKFAANHKPQCKHRTLGHKHKSAGMRFCFVIPFWTWSRATCLPHGHTTWLLTLS